MVGVKGMGGAHRDGGGVTGVTGVTGMEGRTV
jgi:hypothetical protein